MDGYGRIFSDRLGLELGLGSALEIGIEMSHGWIW
jgi:hypothetical protein